MTLSSKKIGTALLTAMLVLGLQISAFASTDPSRDQDPSADASVTALAASSQDESNEDEGLAASDAPVLADGEASSEAAPVTTEAPINSSPNTGLAVAPIAVAGIAAAAVTVMFASRKKKD